MSLDCIISENALEVPSLSDIFKRTNDDIISVYNKFSDTVYRVCFMMLKNIEETEDATQNTFIKYLNCNKEFESDEHIKAWLIVTARNECKNNLTHWFKSKRTDMEDVPEASYEDKGKSEVLEQVLSLDKKYSVPLYLHYYEGYKTSEIAQMLNINHSTLRANMAKARNKLKILLEEEDYED